MLERLITASTCLTRMARVIQLRLVALKCPDGREFEVYANVEEGYWLIHDVLIQGSVEEVLEEEC